MTTAPIRVLVTDDHAIVRRGLCALLATEPDIRVIGEAGNGAAAIAQARALHPDVVLMDLVMPQVDGIEATRQITASQSDVRVLVLTSLAGDDQVFSAIKAGALGYLLKDTGPDELVQAIRQVYQGQPTLDPSIARQVLHELAHPSQEPPTSQPLAEREMQVLRLAAQGKSNREIAKQMEIAEVMVRAHVSSILSKLHLSSRTQAALYAQRGGIVMLDKARNDTLPQTSQNQADT